ncbi:MAG: imidazolonepropionase, partial [Alphaproteobacteria bacterium]|nr:imidazolonepropionase [Alphaproteobacteria bacterium]
MWDHLFLDCHLATMTGGGAPYGALRDAALAVAGGRIAWLGPRAQLPGKPATLARAVFEMNGFWATPGLIDCHTHLVFGGDRSGEFEERLQGKSYEDIAKAGGGIRSTVAATRATGEADLVVAAKARLDRLAAEGVTTVEIKSGYGLDTATEAKMLRVARALSGDRAEIITSFLGAHALPPEYAGRQGAYVDLVCEEMLPAIAQEGLADAVDAFCERIAFTPEETAKVFTAATSLGLPVKLHADQISDQGGAALAARFKALSADHLEYASEEGIKAMAAAGTVAVILPGAYYVLRETKPPPIELLRRHGVAMAIASDCNPGSSPSLSLLLMLNMACTLFRLTPEEALAGVTREAAKALGRAADRGTIEIGKRADLAF